MRARQQRTQDVERSRSGNGGREDRGCAPAAHADVAQERSSEPGKRGCEVHRREARRVIESVLGRDLPDGRNRDGRIDVDDHADEKGEKEPCREPVDPGEPPDDPEDSAGCGPDGYEEKNGSTCVVRELVERQSLSDARARDPLPRVGHVQPAGGHDARRHGSRNERDRRGHACCPRHAATVQGASRRRGGRSRPAPARVPNHGPRGEPGTDGRCRARRAGGRRPGSLHAKRRPWRCRTR